VQSSRKPSVAQGLDGEARLAGSLCFPRKSSLAAGSRCGKVARDQYFGRCELSSSELWASRLTKLAMFHVRPVEPAALKLTGALLPLCVECDDVGKIYPFCRVSRRYRLTLWAAKVIFSSSFTHVATRDGERREHCAVGYVQPLEYVMKMSSDGAIGNF
jgi:hypothetical protein